MGCAITATIHRSAALGSFLTAHPINCMPQRMDRRHSSKGELVHTWVRILRPKTRLVRGDRLRIGISLGRFAAVKGELAHTQAQNIAARRKPASGDRLDIDAGKPRSLPRESAVRM
jgi:hypothetical protein